MPRPLLILRPEPGAGRTLASARALGLAARAYPLFTVEPLSWQAPDPQTLDAIMFTSANAARLGGPQRARYLSLPAYAVGTATAAAAREAGFNIVHVGADGVQTLARDIARRGHHHVLHLSGRHIRPFDPGPLRVTSVPVYAAAESGSSEELLGLMLPDSIALVHSVRAATRLAKLVPMPRRADLSLIAISGTVADAAGLGWGSVVTAPDPSDEAMLALAVALCE